MSRTGAENCVWGWGWRQGQCVELGYVQTETARGEKETGRVMREAERRVTTDRSPPAILESNGPNYRRGRGDEAEGGGGVKGSPSTVLSVADLMLFASGFATNSGGLSIKPYRTPPLFRLSTSLNGD